MIEPKIMPTKVNNWKDKNNFAVYDVEENVIYYDIDLDDFPYTKDFVINHEKQHAKKPLNLFWHMYIDIRDNFRMRVNKRLIQDYNSLIKRRNVRKVGLIWILYYQILYGIITVNIVGIILLLTYPLKFFVKKSSETSPNGDSKGGI